MLHLKTLAGTTVALAPLSLCPFRLLFMPSGTCKDFLSVLFCGHCLLGLSDCGLNVCPSTLCIDSSCHLPHCSPSYLEGTDYRVNLCILISIWGVCVCRDASRCCLFCDIPNSMPSLQPVIILCAAAKDSLVESIRQLSLFFSLCLLTRVCLVSQIFARSALQISVLLAKKGSCVPAWLCYYQAEGIDFTCRSHALQHHGENGFKSSPDDIHEALQQERERHECSRSHWWMCLTVFVKHTVNGFLLIILAY